MDSRTYWRKREERWIREQIKSDKQIAKETTRLLEEAREDIQKEIDSFYAKYANAEGLSISEARKAVSKHDVQRFQATAKRYIKTKDFSPRANQELRLYNATMKINRLELLKAQINLRLSGMTVDLEKLMTDESYRRIIEELERNAGILADSTKFDIEDRAKKIVNGSYKLKDTEVMRTFSDNIWLQKTELVADLEKLLTRSFTQGQNPRVMARNLKDIFKVYGYQAERIARTEMSKISVQIQQQSYMDNEIPDYEFIAEPSACGDCLRLDGKIFKVANMVIGKNAPVIHPNCRCSTSPHIDSRAMYDDWLKRGIINKDDYASLLEFRKDYDTKFEKLMAKRNEYEASMQEKRKARRLK